MLMPGGPQQVMKSYMGSVRKSSVYENKLRQGKTVSVRMQDLTLKVRHRLLITITRTFAVGVYSLVAL
eukprot:12836478-Ditylum_brightwellii.AAC.1